MEQTCDWSIRDGSKTFFCEKLKGHKGRHGSSSKSKDGRIIRISWNQNKFERTYVTDSMPLKGEKQ